MRGRGATARLFVAVYPPEEVRAACLGALRGLGPGLDPAHRETPVEQVHLTLLFVGHVAEKEMGEVAESVERSAAGVGAFRLTPLRLVCFPERGMPRLVAVELDAPAGLMEVRRRLVKRLARERRSTGGTPVPLETERFSPHMTLCRFGGEARARRVGREVSLPGFSVSEIVLFRSVLRPGGAVHSEVLRARLR
ncbi:MAG: RNA 2',3'-cyclic phosphodiesterase [Phycisphaerales bacterium]